MIITVVTDVLGKENNGTTIAAMNLIRYLKGRGHEVRVVCPDETKKQEEGFFIAPVRNLGPINAILRMNGVQLAGNDDGLLRKALKNADVVHVMLPFKLGKAAVKTANELGIPVTAGFHMMAENVTAHLSLMNFKPMNDAIYKSLKPFYDRCFAIHYPTAYLKTLYESFNGPTNGYIISNGVNESFRKTTVTRPKILKDKFVILYTGRLSKEKTHSVLVDGVKRSKYSDRIQLVFAGAGPKKNSIEKRAEGLRNPPIIRFFSRENMLKIINCADLYVHAAEIEAEGISCLEAISCGLVPVISDSPRCATKEYALTEKNLFRYNDPGDLADKIDYWIEHPEEKASLSEKYVEYSADRFDESRCMERMEAMLVDAKNRFVRYAAKE